MSEPSSANPTEATLEARITATLSRVFPSLDIRHQVRFRVRLGRRTIDVDGNSTYAAEGRADVLLTRADRPLAVLELKRSELALTADDRKQGLSYARLLDPPAPLVVVTNGDDVVILDAYTGEPWSATTATEMSVALALAAAARVAASDLKSAIERLLGPDTRCWVEAVRGATRDAVEELCGEWHDAARPFVADFLLPRKATREVLSLLSSGARLISVTGAPLVGKSSVLRELTTLAAESGDFAVLFVESSPAGVGVLEILTDLVARRFGWTASTGEVMSWIQALSNRSDGPALVLALDALALELSDARRDFEHLLGSGLGPGVRLVVALDDTVAEELAKSASGREASRFGRQAELVALNTLDDEEFAEAEQVLGRRRIQFVDGADRAREFRVPWLLRSLIADAADDASRADADSARMLPPLLGCELLSRTRGRFADPEVRRRYNKLARSAVEDSQREHQPPSLRLQAVAMFVATHDRVSVHLDRSDIEDLRLKGYLRLRNYGGETLVIPRLPELVASELAFVFVDELATRAKADPIAAADWLVKVSTALPLGDVVAADAIVQAAYGRGLNLYPVIRHLVDQPPRREAVRPGTEAVMLVPGAGTMNVTFEADGSLTMEGVGGQRLTIPPDAEDDAPHEFTVDIGPWLILSHLASVPMEVQEDPEGGVTRADFALLLTVGACRVPLRRPDLDRNMPMETHDLPGHGRIVCPNTGMVEPITWSMTQSLFRDGPGAEEWVREASRSQSLALLTRVGIALGVAARSKDAKISGRARGLLENVVAPARDKLPLLHGA